MQITSFPNEVAEQLRHYVYAYIDPRDNEIFYIGKGCGNRAFSHLNDLTETYKTKRIASIRQAGLSPEIDIIVHGLDEEEALRIEAICIDLLGFNALTNLVTGHRLNWGGRGSVEQINDEFCAKVVEVKEAAIAITINQSYYYGMKAADLYDATRGIWRVGQRCETAEIALAVYRGIVKEVYAISEWHPAGTTEYHNRTFNRQGLRGRFEFVGKVAKAELRKKYIGKRIGVAKSTQNPIRYINC